MFLVFLVTVLSPLSAAAGGGFSSLWKSTWRNITVPRELPVKGSLPSWLHGSLLRNAGGAFESPARNVTFAFDGIPKIFKFSISDGRVTYQERFLTTLYYEYIESHGDIPKTPLMGSTVPPFSKFAAPKATDGDTTNIQVWHLKGDGTKAFALTDATYVEQFDMDTLQGLGHTPVNDSVKEGIIQLSSAHPQYEPNTDQKVMLNLVTNFLSIPGSIIGQHKLTVFRMGTDLVRRPFGSVTIPYAPYIHSFGVTKSKMIIVVYPLGFDVTCVLEFDPMIQCMRCPRDRHATIYVFDLASTDKSTKPIATVEAPYHMVMHHVNAYEEEASGDIVFEVCAQDDCDTLFAGPTGQHANLAAMQDQSARDKVQHWGKLRTYRVSSTTSKPTLTSFDITPRDADGYVYGVDFPFVNPNFASQQHQYLWALSSYAQNSTHYEDWAVLKIDRAANGINTKVWYKKGHYPMEPVFVPKPNGAEDEGVVLVQVLDGDEDRGYLLVLDAKTMTEIATASLDAGEHLPYSQHGRWFDGAVDTAVVV